MIRPNLFLIIDLAAAHPHKGRPKVDLQNLVKLLIRHPDQQIVAGNTRIIDQNADTVVFRSQRLQRLGKRGGIGDVHTFCHNREARFFYDLLKLPKLLGDDVQPRNGTALLKQLKNDGPANPSGGTGYNRQSLLRHP